MCASLTEAQAPPHAAVLLQVLGVVLPGRWAAASRCSWREEAFGIGSGSHLYPSRNRIGRRSIRPTSSG